MASLKLWPRRVGFALTVWIFAVTVAVAVGLRQSPASAAPGWNDAALDRAFTYAASLGTDALVLQSDGAVVRSLGDVTRPYHIHAIRKSVLSALVGRYLGKSNGRIDLNASLADLNIDERPKRLSPLQRTATVLDLLHSRSGINRQAAAEAGLLDDKQRRLGDGENTPGTIWAYNNWDYNALTTIFEQQTGLSIAEAFRNGFARPLGMQDFSLAHVFYFEERAKSMHRSAGFHLSARDLVRFGQLYLNGGIWNGANVLPDGWTDRVVKDAIPTGGHRLGPAHGMLWWLTGPELALPAGSYRAVGFNQQGIVVIPAWNTVIVHQADTAPLRLRLAETSERTGGSLAEALEDIIKTCQAPPAQDMRFCRQSRLILPGEFAALLRMIAAARLP